MTKKVKKKLYIYKHVFKLFCLFVLFFTFLLTNIMYWPKVPFLKLMYC